MSKSFHGFFPFLVAHKHTSTEMVPLLSVSNCAKISNNSLCSCFSYEEMAEYEGSYLLDVFIAIAKITILKDPFTFILEINQ